MDWRTLLRANRWSIKLAKFMDENFSDIITNIKKVSGNNIVPSRNDMFNAFNLTDYDECLIVILGMDPYPTKGVAHGLSFSHLGDHCPASLKNIFREIRSSVYNNGDVHDDFFNTDLTRWAKQGVLMLNAALTTQTGVSGRHMRHWSQFTLKVLEIINTGHPVCYILLGKDAKNFRKYIDESVHKVLEAGHPSPLNTKIKFLGSDVFKESKEFIKKVYNKDIIW